MTNKTKPRTFNYPEFGKKGYVDRRDKTQELKDLVDKRVKVSEEEGDLFFAPEDNNLYIYDGKSWIPIG